VQRPEARALMARVTTVPTSGGALGSRVVLKLKNGEELEETVDRAHGHPADPLTTEEILGKFHECAATLVPEEQRNRVVALCGRLETLENVHELADAMGAAAT
jgi:2-methylcitrate dehydratase PrpD